MKSYFVLTLILFTTTAFADCVLNRYGQDVCEGGEVLIKEDTTSTNLNEQFKIGQIKNIDYNLITIKVEGKKLVTKPYDLLAERDCTYYQSPFCKEQTVEFKPECSTTKGSFKAYKLFYNDLVLLKKKGAFGKKELAKAHCLAIKE